MICCEQYILCQVFVPACCVSMQDVLRAVQRLALDVQEQALWCLAPLTQAFQVQAAVVVIVTHA